MNSSHFCQHRREILVQKYVSTMLYQPYRTTPCKIIVIYYKRRLFYLEGFTHYGHKVIKNKLKRHFFGSFLFAHFSNFERVSDSISCFHKAERMRAACIWFHREVVNMPVFPHLCCSDTLSWDRAALKCQLEDVGTAGQLSHTQTYTSHVSAHNMGGCYCECPLAAPDEMLTYCKSWMWSQK